MLRLCHCLPGVRVDLGSEFKQQQLFQLKVRAIHARSIV